MEAEAKSFNFLSIEGLVRVPFFQRGYIWEKDNWEDLLTNLLNTTSSHFLGSVVFKQQSSATGKPKEVLVIDGQQRLTTISILLKALYDTFTSELKNNCEGPIRAHLFYKKNSTGSEYLVKIQHSHVDSEAYKKVIRAGIDGEDLEVSSKEKNKILQCYNYLRDKLGQETPETRDWLFNFILDFQNKMLVVIDLEEEDDEQAIFDTINSTGVRLSAADTIKNTLFQKAIRLLGEERAVTLYDETWKEVFLSDEESISFWDTQRLTGRLFRDNIEILLHSIAVIKGFYNPDEHTLSDLAKLYKGEIANYNSEKLSLFINEIKDYAEIYREKLPSFDSDTLYSFEDNIQRLLHILDVLQISTFHPFILYLFKTNPDNIDLILKNLERFVVRRVIAKKETKSFNKLCKSFIDNPESITERLNETTNEQVSSGLKVISSNKNAALLLFWIELYRRNNKKADTKEWKFTYSLEHIMPQKWEEHWKEMPDKMNTQGEKMSPAEAKIDRYEKIYWIGNMTLLTSSLNSSLHNYGFDIKMNGEGRKKGIKDYADLSITRADIVDVYNIGDTVWNELKIINRTEKLTEEILAIWDE